jgi:hypothetical protein
MFNIKVTLKCRRPQAHRWFVSQRWGKDRSNSYDPSVREQDW